ncbi:site-2 protease family protein [Rhizomonospora bruguierae]|uniref:site-2 protease family protein n=1 Tax=Rhizomonospora bruguierae TaxID=1581705 RepID=UPI001BCCBE67|nr:site-2 protease family protein [Micromonospora sp. NBRC 107566]
MSDRLAGGRLVVGVPRDALRPSGVFLCLVALFITSGAMTWNNFGNVRLDAFLFVLSGWLVSLCLHEYAHAVIAFRSGDVAVAQRGYLTLNPLKYSHWLLSLALPLIAVVLGGIGLPGGAVWVDHGAVRGRLRHTLISAAGPATNVLFALLLAVPFWIGVNSAAHPAFWIALSFLGFLQVTASVLNLVPMPGLDGGNILHPWLPGRYRRGYDAIAPFGFLLLFAMLWNPRVGGWFFTGVYHLADALGLPPQLYRFGLDLIRFWSGG